MIHLQVLSTPDPLTAKEHLFYFNEILLSNDPKTAHLIIDDQDMDKTVMRFSVAEGSVRVETLPKQRPYISNGKKNIGAKLHQAGDEITFGQTVVKIINFQQTINEHELPLPERYKKAIQNPNNAKILETFEAELLHLEYLLNADNE